MLRKFTDSLIIVKYMSIVFTMAAVTLAVAMVYNFTKIQAFYYLAILCGVAEFCMIILFSLERVRASRQLIPITRKEDYNYGIFTGNCILIDRRMLAYQHGKVIESDYSNIKDVHLIGRPGKYTFRMTIGSSTYDAVVGSQENAEELAAFLHAKNPGIVFYDVEPKGKGTYKSIQHLSQERPKM